MLFSYPAHEVADFNIMPCKKSSNSSDSLSKLRVMILTTYTPSSRRYIQILSLPSYTISYQIEVSNDCWLVKNTVSSDYFTMSEGFVDDDYQICYFIESIINYEQGLVLFFVLRICNF